MSIPIPKNIIKVKKVSTKLLSCIFLSELGIRSNKLIISMTDRDKLMQNVINSSCFLIGKKIDKHPISVENPAIDAKINGQIISFKVFHQ